MRLLAFLTLLASFAIAPSALAESRPCEEKRCVLTGEDGGSYRMVWPKGGTAKPAGGWKPFIFYHGFNGSGDGIARNRNLARTLHKGGYVLVAPNGPTIVWRGKERRGWGGYRGADRRWGMDTLRFMERVMADIEARTGMKAAQAVHSGFSSGGSMAWYVGCYGRPRARAVVPIAGGLRRPYPEETAQGPARVGTTCPGGPVPVMHIHGFGDNQVPLEGRAIANWHQGDVHEGLDILRRTNGCVSRPNAIEVKGRLWCRDWTGCASGQPVRSCLHSGGHSTPRGWPKEALDWVKSLPPR